MARRHPSELVSECGHRAGPILIALALYALAFALPVKGGEFGGGLGVFYLGAWATMVTVLYLPIQLLDARSSGWTGRDAEFLLLVACWLANPVFWYALWQSAWGRWRRAGVASFLAVGLASIVGFMAVAKSPPQHEYFGPAYLAWLGSMVWLCGTALFRRLRV